jgi:hypothetical protein
VRERERERKYKKNKKMGKGDGTMHAKRVWIDIVGVE